VTFSVSVDRNTKKLLRDLADRAYQGNVSALIVQVAQQAARQEAATELLRSHGRGPMTDEECEAFEAEVVAELARRQPRKRRRRKAA
jgi:hypothetical protein